MKECKCCKKPIASSRRTYCSNSCKNTAWKNRCKEQQRYKSLTCERCGKLFTVLRHLGYAQSEKICSECKTMTKRCKECDTIFTTTSPRRRFCSKACNKKNSRRIYSLKKRTNRSLNSSDESITIKRLMIRDNNKCHLCEGEVDATKHYNHNLYPSIDHVIPLARGGTHTWDNVRLAHRICNSLKRDYVIDKDIEFTYILDK